MVCMGLIRASFILSDKKCSGFSSAPESLPRSSRYPEGKPPRRPEGQHLCHGAKRFRRFFPAALHSNHHNAPNRKPSRFAQSARRSSDKSCSNQGKISTEQKNGCLYPQWIRQPYHFRINRTGFLLSICCHQLNIDAWKPHKYWISGEHFIIRTPPLPGAWG